MSKVTVREAIKNDIVGFSTPAGVAAPTLRGWVGEIDGKPVALGGFALAMGRWIGFVDVTEEGRDLLKKNMYVRAAFVGTAVKALREARRMGVRYIYADADMRFPRADELLEKLGFHVDPRTESLYRWTP
jgi:GNAT superfamily N-acetyltransferase